MMRPDRRVSQTESIEWFMEHQFFSASHDMAPPHAPIPPPLPVGSTGDTQEDWERQLSDWQGGGRGCGRSQIIQRRLYKSFNTLWSQISSCFPPEDLRSLEMPRGNNTIFYSLLLYMDSTVLWRCSNAGGGVGMLRSICVAECQG